MANAAYAEWADNAANKYGIPTELFRSLIDTESGWNPAAISPKNAYGLTQLMPGTARDLGVNRYDVRQNIEGGAKYLAQQYETFGNWKDALAAYNAGPNNIQAGQGYAQEVLSGAGMASADNGGTEGQSWGDWLYGKDRAKLSLGSDGNIKGTNAAGETADISAENMAPSLYASIAKLFTWEFWQSIFSNALAVVAVIALIIFGIYALLNQAKAVAK